MTNILKTKDWRWMLGLALLLPSILSGQVFRAYLEDRIENADLIVTGRTFQIIFLGPPFETKRDAAIIRVQVFRTLRGVGPDTVEILDTFRGSHFGPLLVFEGRQYLMFLEPVQPDSSLATKYQLSGRRFYYPFAGDVSTVDLNTAKGQEELQRTEQFLSLLPPVPDPSIPVEVLLDSLVAQKHHAYEVGWIGDKNFVHELDNHLDNAKRHLQQRDSLNTVQQVLLFQEKVDRKHERTKQKQEQGVPRDPRFVTREGYLLLHYNAQYILDRLPKRR